MGEKTPVRARFVAWLLLLWLFIFVWIGMGGVIVYSAFQDGQVVLGSGTALVFAALIVYAARAWYRDSARRRALVAAWTWWKDSDVQDRQWHLITQPFKQPFADALPALEQATQQTPSDADAWVRLAETLSRVGRREEALAASEHALALDPQLASAWVSKGAALEELGRDAEALDAYDRAVAFGIERAAPWFPVTVGLTRCRLLARLGRYKEALQACDQVLAIQPNLALAWYFKATCLGAWGRRADRAEAAATLLRAKELAG